MGLVRASAFKPFRQVSEGMSQRYEEMGLAGIGETTHQMGPSTEVDPGEGLEIGVLGGFFGQVNRDGFP